VLKFAVENLRLDTSPPPSHCCGFSSPSITPVGNTPKQSGNRAQTDSSANRTPSLQAAVALVEALSSPDVIRVADNLAVCPKAILEESVRECIIRLIPRLAFADKVCTERTRGGNSPPCPPGGGGGHCGGVEGRDGILGVQSTALMLYSPQK